MLQNWTSTKLEYLQGDDYAGNDEDQSMLIFTTASGFDYGDVFIFADYADWNDTAETDGI